MTANLKRFERFSQVFALKNLYKKIRLESMQSICCCHGHTNTHTLVSFAHPIIQTYLKYKTTTANTIDLY